MDILRFVRHLSPFARGNRANMKNLPGVGPVNESHAVFSDRSNFDFPPETKKAIFGMGCFWGVEKLFWNLSVVHPWGTWKK